MTDSSRPAILTTAVTFALDASRIDAILHGDVKAGDQKSFGAAYEAAVSKLEARRKDKSPLTAKEIVQMLSVPVVHDSGGPQSRLKTLAYLTLGNVVKSNDVMDIDPFAREELFQVLANDLSFLALACKDSNANSKYLYETLDLSTSLLSSIVDAKFMPAETLSSEEASENSKRPHPFWVGFSHDNSLALMTANAAAAHDKASSLNALAASCVSLVKTALETYKIFKSDSNIGGRVGKKESVLELTNKQLALSVSIATSLFALRRTSSDTANIIQKAFENEKYFADPAFLQALLYFLETRESDSILLAYFPRHVTSSFFLVLCPSNPCLTLPPPLPFHLALLLTVPKNVVTREIARILRIGTNYNIFCGALSRVQPISSAEGVAEPGKASAERAKWEGFNVIVDAISNTLHDKETMSQLLICVANACGASDDEKFQKKLIEAKALTLLQPAVQALDKNVSLDAAYTIGVIASYKGKAIDGKATEEIESSNCLTAIEERLRTFIPGDNPFETHWLQRDVPVLMKLLSPDVGSAIQLATLHRMANTLEWKIEAALKADAKEEDIHKAQMDAQRRKASGENSKRIFKAAPQLVGAVRVCAMTTDTFVYVAAIFVLAKLGEPVPGFTRLLASGQTFSASKAASVPLEGWSIDRVCDWAGTQPFRVYRSTFRDNFVDGKLLVELKEQDLVRPYFPYSAALSPLLFLLTPHLPPHPFFTA